MEISFNDFLKVEICTGTVLEARFNKKACKQSLLGFAYPKLTFLIPVSTARGIWVRVLSGCEGR